MTRLRQSAVRGVFALAILGVSAAPSQASLFTVTSTSSSAATSGSLPWAVQRANSTAGHDFIRFQIAGSGVHIITLDTTLVITDSVTINAKTQPGYAGAPRVYIEGGALDFLVQLEGASSVSTIQGLGFYDYAAGAIAVLTASTGNWIQDNYIGFFSDGIGPVLRNRDVPHAGSVGVAIISSFNVVRRNTISGVATGVVIGEDPAQTPSGTTYVTNAVQYNDIGTDPGGTTSTGYGNTADGILLAAGARYNFIGPGNVLSGNSASGVSLFHPTTTYNLIIQNCIGLDRACLAPIGNSVGVQVANGAESNFVGRIGTGNIIAANTEAGISFGATPSGSFTGHAQFNEAVGNIVGLNWTQTSSPGAQRMGLVFSNGSSYNWSVANVLAGNSEHGVFMSDAVGNSAGNSWIGRSWDGVPQANGGFGFFFHDSRYNQAYGDLFGVNALGPVGSDGTSCCNTVFWYQSSLTIEGLDELGTLVDWEKISRGRRQPGVSISGTSNDGHGVR